GRLAADRDAVRRAAPRLAVAGGCPEPSDRGLDGGRAAGGAAGRRGARARRAALRLPLPTSREGGHAAAPGAGAGGGGRVPGRAGTDRQRGGARLPRTPTQRPQTPLVNVSEERVFRFK